MSIDISECKKYWACRTHCEPINRFVAVRDINMLIGYVEQFQAEKAKVKEVIELFELCVQEVRENDKPAYLIMEKKLFDKALAALRKAGE